jgi:peptidoglycan/LPS O-acetylase OafA/YrhL
MDSFSSTIVSFFLLLAAAGLMIWHVRAWRHAQQQNLDDSELDFRRRQFRRRIQTSALLGVLAAALFIGQFLTGPQALLFIYWGVTLLLVAWVALLAVVDALATKFHFARLREKFLVEQAKLQAEIRRIQAAKSNGKAREQ